MKYVHLSDMFTVEPQFPYYCQLGIQIMFIN